MAFEMAVFQSAQLTTETTLHTACHGTISVTELQLPMLLDLSFRNAFSAEGKNGYTPFSIMISLVPLWNREFVGMIGVGALL